MTLRKIAEWLEGHYDNWAGLLSGDLSVMDMPFDSIFWGLMLIAWIVLGSLYLLGLALGHLESSENDSDINSR